MRVLVACEESQVVTIAFRELGHEAHSCDIEPCSGGHPEWHIQDDVLRHLEEGWDLMIAFPPCTYLTVTGNKWMKPEYAGRFPTRKHDRELAVGLFMALVEAPILRIAIENPVGIMSTRYRKPDQIIQPYYFGDPERKTTCLWLKNLPRLVWERDDNLFSRKTDVTPRLYTFANGRHDGMWHIGTIKLPPKERARQRSKTFPGIARAMAEQWGGNYIAPALAQGVLAVTR